MKQICCFFSFIFIIPLNFYLLFSLFAFRSFLFLRRTLFLYYLFIRSWFCFSDNGDRFFLFSFFCSWCGRRLACITFKFLKLNQCLIYKFLIYFTTFTILSKKDLNPSIELNSKDAISGEQTISPLRALSSRFSK